MLWKIYFVDDDTNDWIIFLKSADLPASLNPPQGYVVSANNRPASFKTRIGYFYTSNDRNIRIRQRIRQKEKMSVGDIKNLQRDVYHASAFDLSKRIIEITTDHNTSTAPEDVRHIIQMLKNWDGYFRTRSQGALVIELLKPHLAHALWKNSPQSAQKVRLQTDGLTQRLIDALQQIPEDVVKKATLDALRKIKSKLSTYNSWGDIHRLRLQHPLGFLPIVGHNYVFADQPVAGNNQTIFKNAYVPSPHNDKHRVTYGSAARLVADMSDPDNTWAVMLGGQDGFLGSSTYADQVELFSNGDYVQLPLRSRQIQRHFPYVSKLQPIAKEEESEAKSDDLQSFRPRK